MKIYILECDIIFITKHKNYMQKQLFKLNTNKYLNIMVVFTVLLSNHKRMNEWIVTTENKRNYKQSCKSQMSRCITISLNVIQINSQ